MTDNINSVSLHGNNNTDRDELHYQYIFYRRISFHLQNELANTLN